jgi:chemotaxis response regulator CheB
LVGCRDDKATVGSDRHGMTKRVIVADDSPAYLELLLLVLAQRPELEVVGTATNGDEAVRAAVEFEADVALLDVEMPRLDGFGAASEIRRLRPGTLLFLHTGGLVDEFRRHGAELSLRVFDKLHLHRTLDLIASGSEARAA